MSEPILEHVNITVSDSARTAEMLQQVFGWKVRWEGPSIDGGTSVHVGGANSYLAIYSPKKLSGAASDSYTSPGGLNHVGVVVDDIEETEARVIAQGYETHSHAYYEPGRRFYFNDHDDIEFEVVSYTGG